MGEEDILDAIDRAASSVDDAMYAVGTDHPEYERLHDIHVQLVAIGVRAELAESHPSDAAEACDCACHRLNSELIAADCRCGRQGDAT